MKFSVLKVIVLVTVIQVSWAGVAYGNLADTETSSGNTFGATTLDFLLSASDLFNETGIVPGLGWYIEPLTVSKVSGIDFDYEVWFAKTGGDDALCTALELKARQDSVLVYSGSLAAFSYDAGIISGGSDDWSFEILFNNDDVGLQNLGCQFDFVYRGEQPGGAGFYDVEQVSNSIATGTWGAEAGDVVINEIMWMGSNAVSDADEWIELKNTTGDAIDLAGWTIDEAGSGSSAITITSGVIPAGGYFLIGNYASSSSAISDAITIDLATTGVSLANGGEVLTLKDATNNVIDTTPTGVWEDGNNNDAPAGQRNSMERNDTPGDGTSWDDWHTCLDAGCNDGVFWDVDDGDDYGTPKAANLSENDPTCVSEESEESVSESEGEGGKEEESEDGKLEEDEELVDDDDDDTDDGDGGDDDGDTSDDGSDADEDDSNEEDGEEVLEEIEEAGDDETEGDE